MTHTRRLAVNARSAARSAPEARLIVAGLALWVGALGACSSATLQSAGGFRDQNRSKVASLRVGMPREEVLAIMGDEALPNPLGSEGSGAARTERDTMGVTQIQLSPGARAPSLYNPMRSATYRSGDSGWEVLFYYVRLVEDDGVVTDDELDPVVLRDGYLAGVGWAFWEETARAEGIDLELTEP